MRVAQRQPLDGRQARMSRGLNADELRVQLSEAIERFDHHTREAEDLGRANNTVAALQHIKKANEAADEAAAIADRITALGSDRPGAIARRNRGLASSWITEPTR